MDSADIDGQVLRLTVYWLTDSRHRIEIAVERPGKPRQIALGEFHFELTQEDQEAMRWYFEDFLQVPIDPVPAIAASIENRMIDIGNALFQSIFEHSDDTKRLWSMISDRLNSTRIEIVSSTERGILIPWELMRDPTTDFTIALHAQAFVRALHQTVRVPRIPDLASRPIRILLVICRPDGADDVPFRSVAMRLIGGLSEATREDVQLDILRPSTFDSLANRLRSAKASSSPYHVVHFDGHGAYLDMQVLFEQWKGGSNNDVLGEVSQRLGLDPRLYPPTSIYPRQPRRGAHGYLSFEDSESECGFRYVDGIELGELLVETDVPILVLNACRSAYSQPYNKPQMRAKDKTSDIHSQIRSYGSLAQEVMDIGIAGVVAMQYNVYVETAARFVAELYSKLASGQALGTAVTFGRKYLATQPLRQSGSAFFSLQDWYVPLVYEENPIRLFAPRENGVSIDFMISPSGVLHVSPMHHDLTQLPEADLGFIGRDETILALDRSFDSQHLVLIYGNAGSGKTTIAAEFARWYFVTGGVKGRILYTKFNIDVSFLGIMEQLADALSQHVNETQVNWHLLPKEKQLQVILQILEKVPLFWILDNIEIVIGFPPGERPIWNADERCEFVQFLRAALKTKAKFLLTSRRDERMWLGDLPTRIVLPAMSVGDRVRIARALTNKYSTQQVDLGVFYPLFQYARGNPWTTIIVIRQALRLGIKTATEADEFAQKLQSGEATIEDDALLGSDKALVASLRYGIETAFNEDERGLLAILCLFQGFVEVGVLIKMGDPKRDWSLPRLENFNEDDYITLFDRASEVGILTRLRSGHYEIHPAIPWFFHNIYQKSWSNSEGQQLIRAFVGAMGLFCWEITDIDQHRSLDVSPALYANIENIYRARSLAEQHGLYGELMHTTYALFFFHHKSGIHVRWRQLVESMTPIFVDVEQGTPLPGKEEYWDKITFLRIYLAISEESLDEAKKMSRSLAQYHQGLAQEALDKSPEKLNYEEVNSIRSLATSLNLLGDIEFQNSNVNCAEYFQEAYRLVLRIKDRTGAATIAFSLSKVFLGFHGIRNLDEAQKWCSECLRWTPNHDLVGLAHAYGQMAFIATDNLRMSIAQHKSKDIVLQNAASARQNLNRSLELFPPDAYEDLAKTHRLYGEMLATIGDLANAVGHYNIAIQHAQNAENLFLCGFIRKNAAEVLFYSERYPQALHYAQTALEDYRRCRFGSSERLKEVEGLVSRIERKIQV